MNLEFCFCFSVFSIFCIFVNIILNILYYKFIKKSQKIFFLKTRFSRFVTPGIRKCKKKIPRSSQLSNFIFFFYKTNFYSVDGVWYVSVAPWFGDIRYAPLGFPRAGEFVLCRTNVVFTNFYIRPFFNLVTANDKYKKSSEGFFFFS